MRQIAYAGIDPGMSKQAPGAWAILPVDGEPVTEIWPQEGFSAIVHTWMNLDNLYDIRLAVLERQQVFPKQGAVTGGKIMENYGQWQGLLSGLQIPFRIENAKTWQAHILDAGKGRHKGREAVKAASLDHAQRLFPRVDWSLKKYQGKADALNMALYAKRIGATL